MGTAKVSDIKSFFPGMTNVNDNRMGKVQGTDDFASLISDAAAKNAPAQGADTGEAVKQAPKSTRPVQKADNADAGRIRKDGSEDSTGDVSSKVDTADKKGIEARISEKADKIKDAIKEELGVSDEELEDAMASLGFVPVDLFNADNIKGLMLELSGESDPLALITNEELLTSITDVTELMTQFTGEIEEEFGLPMEDIGDILDSIKASEEMPAVSAEPEEDDEVESGSEDKGVRVEIIRKDEGTDVRTANETSAESASLDRKASRIMDERKQEDGMQNAMTGQNFNTDNVEAGSTVAAQPEFTSAYVDAEDILSQVTDRIKVEIGEDSTSMELQLHPASLGTVNLQINSNGGVVTAHLLVQNEAVKSALEGQLVQLLQTFEEQGQKVEAIEVSVAGYDLDRSLNQNSNTGSNERQERRADGVGRSARRRINLNELDEEDLEELTQEEQLAAEMMTANGGSVDFTA